MNTSMSLGQLLRGKINADKAKAATIPEWTMHRVFEIRKSDGTGEPRYIRNAKNLSHELQDDDYEVSTVYVRQGNAQSEANTMFCVQTWSDLMYRYLQSYYYDFDDAVNAFKADQRPPKHADDISIHTYKVCD